MATTESANSEKNSLGEEAMHTTLPLKKAASPGRVDRELTPCSSALGDGVGAATKSRVRLARSAASCPRESSRGSLLLRSFGLLQIVLHAPKALLPPERRLLHPLLRFHQTLQFIGHAIQAASDSAIARALLSVSYTHLTLPTICSV